MRPYLVHLLTAKCQMTFKHSILSERHCNVYVSLGTESKVVRFALVNRKHFIIVRYFYQPWIGMVMWWFFVGQDFLARCLSSIEYCSCHQPTLSKVDQFGLVMAKGKKAQKTTVLRNRSINWKTLTQIDGYFYFSAPSLLTVEKHTSYTVILITLAHKWIWH